MAPSLIVVAIAGSTGLLGLSISRIFLDSRFKSSFARVICLTRDPKSAKALELASLGADIYQIPHESATDEEARDSLRKNLKGVDVLINALSTPAANLKEVLADVAVDVGVKVYFPSEFGTDHRLNNFGEWESHEWRAKQLHAHRVRELAKASMKVICLYTGIFQEIAISAFLGLDVANRKFVVIGSPDVRTAYTSLPDIGRAVVQLSILSMSNSVAMVPDHVHIAGDLKSIGEIKALCENGIGSHIVLERVDLTAFRDEVKESYTSGKRTDLIGHLKIVMAEGIMDHSKNSDNDLINPGETIWKWQTLEKYITENISS